ncbi:MAG: acetyl-CoA carboxylase biotin carboxyl carrier protein [Spirochaetia bacterium]|nr:acetyl-CoA carboxylase biotin carboxyl carrier protein [Spirochaetia bacterium]
MTIEYIRSLIEVFESSSLTELHLNDEGQEITLKREKEIQVLSAPVHSAPPAPQPIPAAGDAAPFTQEADTIIIPSPIVGTFYRTPAPDSPPFVEVGDTVKAGDALCIIEAMKMMNRLEAEFPCEIVAIHANHGDLVEYDGALIEVRRI